MSIAYAIMILAIPSLLNLQVPLNRYRSDRSSKNSPVTFSPGHSAVLDDEAYLRWLQEARFQSLNLSSTEEPVWLRYRAMCGLGHQLGRLSSAYHLAMLYQIPRVWPTENPVCGGTIFTIYNHLIGEGQLMVDVPFFGEDNNLFRNRSLFSPLPPGWPNLKLDNNRTATSPKRGIDLNNEVPGYSLARYMIWPSEGYLYEQNFYGKDQTDYQMYHQLMLLFEHKHKTRIHRVLENTRFNEHTVFGLHVRTGNGETGDFKRKGRGMNDLEGWIKNVVHLLCGYQDNHSHYFTKKPLMVYVGTDTGSVVHKLQQAASNATCHIPFVSSDQGFFEEGGSVSWSHKYHDNDECLKGWEDMFLDMYLFTRCNSVLAGTYSSFTQTAPLSFIMYKAKQWQQQQQPQPQQEQGGNEEKTHHNLPHPHYFCDVGLDGRRMDCATTLIEWLRQTPHMTWGSVNATKQSMKHEITFPLMEQGNVIAHLFEGTPYSMMDVVYEREKYLKL